MYWGSVRFFKHLIIVTIVTVVLTLSTALTISLVRSRALSSELTDLKETVFALTSAPAPSPPDGADLDPPDLPAYQLLYPALYAQTPTQFEPLGEKVMYLTFDDGPSQHTASILDTLREHDVKATFFVIGRNVKNREDDLRRIVDEGHTLAIHTYTHELTDIYASVEAFLEDFNLVYQLLLEETGVAPTIFRFPGGSINGYNSTTYHAIIAEMVRRGFIYYDWNISASDASSSATVQSVRDSILSSYFRFERGIVLMHEKAYTLSALGEVISAMRESGYTFEALTNQVKPIVFTYTG